MALNSFTPLKRTLIIFVSAILLLSAAAAYWPIKSYKQEKIARLSKRQLASQHSEPAPDAQFFLFGDSRAEYWPMHHWPSNTYNAGIAGDLTPNMLWRVHKDVINHNPEAVIIFAGINDIVTASLMPGFEHDQTLDKTFNNLTQIITLLKSTGCKIILFTITPPIKPDIFRRMVWGHGIEDDVLKVNSAINQLADDQVTVVDTMEVFMDAGDNWQEIVSADALHYSSLGYQLLTDSIALHLTEMP